MSVLVTWAILSVGLFVASQILSKMRIEGGVLGHIVVGGAFGLVLALTGGLIHFGLGMMSFGLTWVFGFLGQVLVGAVVLKITDLFSDRLEVKGIGTAVLASLILSLVANVSYGLL